MKNVLLVVFLIAICVYDTFAQVAKEQTLQVQQLKTFAQKGTKLFVKCDCWDDNLFEQAFLTELRGKGIWRIVNNEKEANFILYVNAWFRPQVEGTVYEAYVMVYDNSDNLLYKSDIYIGQPTALNGYDPRKASVKNLINDGFLKEIPESKWFYNEPLNLLGNSKIAEDKYNASEDLFWQGVDYFNQFNYKESISFFTKAQSLNPYNAYTYEYRAISFYNISKYKDARKDILIAMKLDPTNTQNDTTYYNIMVGKNNKFMKTWGSGGTMDRINGAFTAVNQSIATINNSKVSTISEPSNVKQSTKEKTQIGTKQQICTFCNGTGSNPSKEYPAEFGLGHSYHDYPCDICGGYTNHYHKQCPSCAGKGYKKVFAN